MYRVRSRSLFHVVYDARLYGLDILRFFRDARNCRWNVLHVVFDVSLESRVDPLRGADLGNRVLML